MNDSRTDARESLVLLVVASAATLALWFVPFVGVFLYPVRLFVTYVHEICHATAAILTLGSPREIELYADASGLTVWTGGVRLVVQAAGYVVTPLVGAAFLLLAARRRTVRPALVGAGVVLLVATCALAGNALAWVAGLALGPTLVALGALAPPRVARFALSFLAVQCMLGAVGDFKTLLFLSAARPEITTDAAWMAESTGGLVPAVVWTLLWAGMSLVTLAVALRAYYHLTVSSTPLQSEVFGELP